MSEGTGGRGEVKRVGKKQNDRQEILNRHYSGKIIRVLSEPIQDESEKSDVSYNEAKKILKHTIRRIKNLRITF